MKEPSLCKRCGVEVKRVGLCHACKMTPALPGMPDPDPIPIELGQTLDLFEELSHAHA
jgi:hypothetical protein